jgi:ferredoxin, 2Fe-2S
MPNVRFTHCEEKIKVTKDKTILDVAFENLIELEHNCGGVCSCTACLVFIKSGKEYLNKISEDEIYQLKTDNRFSTDARLACQCRIITDENVDIIVEIPSLNNGA